MEELLGDYLRAKGVDVRSAAGEEMVAHCWWCPDGDPKGRGKLYLNAESWLYDCKRCGVRGNRASLAAHFGDVVEDSTGSHSLSRQKVYEAYVRAAEDLLCGNEAHLLYLFRRGLSAETVATARLGYVPRHYGISETLEGVGRARATEVGLLTKAGREFHAGRLIIPYLSSGSVLQVRGKDPDGKYLTPPGDVVRLFNVDALRGAEHVIVTEGEFDALILAQHLAESPDAYARSLAVVGLPGAGALPRGAEDFPSYFRHASKVFLALDPDEVGRREAVKIKALLGSRARIVEMPGEEPKCDWTEYLRERNGTHPHGGHGWRDVLALLREADVRGKRLFSMYDAGIRWRREETEQPGLALGFPTLDTILRPGLRPGNVAVPLAKTGTGKTVFLANVAYNTRSRRVLFATLEMTASDVYAILRRVARFWHPTFTDDAVAEVFPYLRIVDENRLAPEDFALLVEEYREEVGERPELVLLDYLGYYARGRRGGSPYEKVSDGIMQLKAEAKTHGLAVIAPHQVNRGAKDGRPFDADEARDSGVVEETGDFILGLYRPGDAEEVRNAGHGLVASALNLSVLKSRRGGKGRVVPLHMSAVSLAIVDAVDRVAVNRVELENYAHNRGKGYEEIHAGLRADALARAQLNLGMA